MSALLRIRQYPAYLFLAAYSVIVLVPLGWMLISSVKPRGEMFTRPFALPSGLNWGGYERAFTGGLFRYMGNSVIVTGLSVIIIVLVGGLAAYALARMRFLGRNLVYGLVIAAYAIPLHGILVPLYDTIVRFGLTNTYFALVLPYVTFGLPFTVTIFYAFFIDFPDEIVEAARMDGCSDFGALWRIVVPLSMPAVASVAIFQGVQIWNEFLLAATLTSFNARTITTGLSEYVTTTGTEWGRMWSITSRNWA